MSETITLLVTLIYISEERKSLETIDQFFD